MVGFIIALLTVVEVMVALLLIAIILIQPSKQGGGLGAMGGGMTETVFGPTAGTVLTKATVVLASVFLVATLLLAVITGHRRPGKSVIDKLPTPAATQAEAPALPTQIPSQKPEATSAAAAVDQPAATGNQSTPAAAPADSVKAPQAGTQPAAPAAEAAKPAPAPQGTAKPEGADKAPAKAN